MVGVINDALNGFGGQRLAAARGDVKVDDDRAEREDFGEEDFVDPVLSAQGEQLLPRPFPDAAACGEMRRAARIPPASAWC